MKLDGHDLNEALRPLMADPVADATRVLAALPQPKAIPRIAWWLFAAGLLVGVFVGPFVLPSRTPEKVIQDPPPETVDPEKKEGPRPDEQERIGLYSLGAMVADEPVAGRQTLQAGMWWVELGSRFETADSLAGMLLAYDVQLRLDRRTKAAVGSPRRFSLQSGRIWVHSGMESKQLLVIGTPRGLVDVVGTANIVIRGGALRVLSLSGHAVVHVTGGDPVEVRAGHEFVATDAGTEGPSLVPFLPAATSWMTRLLVYQQDRTELEARVKRLVKAFFGTEYRAQAERELRRVGDAAVPALVQSLMATPGLRPAFARKVANMACVMGGPATLDYLFQLLAHADAAVRVAAFRRIHAISGDDGGTDAEYWADEANRSGHAKTIRAWWERLR